MFKVASVFVWRHGGLLIDAVITSISDAAAPRGAMSRQGQRQERNEGQAAARGLWRGTDLTRIVLRGDAGGYRETQPPHTSGLHSVSEPARGGGMHIGNCFLFASLSLCVSSPSPCGLRERRERRCPPLHRFALAAAVELSPGVRRRKVSRAD